MYLYKRNDEIYESLKEETNNMLLLCSEAERIKIFSAIGYLTEYNDSPNTPIGKDLTRSIENYIQHCINTVPESITPLLELNPFGSSYAKIFPELIDHIDKDEKLLKLRYLKEIDKTKKLIEVPEVVVRQGNVFYKDHVIRIHPLLSHYIPNYPLRKFSQIIDQISKGHSNIFVSLALDFDNVLTIDNYSRTVLKSYEYGPKFDLDQIDRLLQKGTTVHFRDKNTINEFGLQNLERLEIYWSQEDSIAKIQMEEIFTIPSDSSQTLTRYVHAERNTKTHQWQHLDGAICIYPIVEYQKRYGAKFPSEVRAKKKIKLFRIDGQFSDEICLQLVEEFFTNNELVKEYLHTQ